MADLDDRHFREKYRGKSPLFLQPQLPQQQYLIQRKKLGSGLQDAIVLQKISIYHGSITDDVLIDDVECVVLPANEKLWADGSGVCGAIFKKAGYDKLQKACNTITSQTDDHSIPNGQSVITKGFDLNVKYIIHTIAPCVQNNEDLMACYISALELCVKMGIRNVAIPCVGTGDGNFSKESACSLALRCVRGWLCDAINVKYLDFMTKSKAESKKKKWHNNIEKKQQNDEDDIYKVNDETVADRILNVVFCCYDDDNWKLYSQVTPKIFPAVNDKHSYLWIDKIRTLEFKCMLHHIQSLEMENKQLKDGTEYKEDMEQSNKRNGLQKLYLEMMKAKEQFSIAYTKSSITEEIKANPKSLLKINKETLNTLNYLNKMQEGINEFIQNVEGINNYVSTLKNDYIFDNICGPLSTSGEHHEYKPKFKNIKEEMLHNPFASLSIKNWNQTTRKSKLIDSWEGGNIRTNFKGYYYDSISKHTTKWVKGEVINMKDIVTLKLYTDFGKLKLELKNCFRLNNFCNLYHWPSDLMIKLNKYGIKMNSYNNMRLYYGVNSTMFINQPTQLELCQHFGPLSTSSSYHVASTFATNKGMVIEISSKYPQLGLCTAFDASIISDYPEEQEWLIGFIYLRIRKVFTRPLNNQLTFNDIDNRFNQMPLLSQTRLISFAIHLFSQQIFSMSADCEYYLAAFLYCACGYNDAEEEGSNINCEIKRTNFVKMLSKNKENNRRDRILNILWEKFDNFRDGNIIKFDTISENLKAYFLDFNTENNNIKTDKYIISFDKITKIFPNVEEIQFLNNYKLNNNTLDSLIKILNGNTKLVRIKFLFYENDFIPENMCLIEDKLEANGWELTHNNIYNNELNDNTGYEIQINKHVHLYKRIPNTTTQFCVTCGHFAAVNR